MNFKLNLGSEFLPTPPTLKRMLVATVKMLSEFVKKENLLQKGNSLEPV
jgi:hypothetical protein